MSNLPRHVSYKDFDVSKLSTSGPQRKNVPNSTQVYYELPIQYDYGTDGTELIADLRIEYPKVNSPFGIKTFEGENGKQNTYMLSAVLPPEGETVVLKKLLEDLYKGCAQLIGVHKDNVTAAHSRNSNQTRKIPVSFIQGI